MELTNGIWIKLYPTTHVLELFPLESLKSSEIEIVEMSGNSQTTNKNKTEPNKNRFSMFPNLHTQFSHFPPKTILFSIPYSLFCSLSHTMFYWKGYYFFSSFSSYNIKESFIQQHSVCE